MGKISLGFCLKEEYPQKFYDGMWSSQVMYDNCGSVDGNLSSLFNEVLGNMNRWHSPGLVKSDTSSSILLYPWDLLFLSQLPLYFTVVILELISPRFLLEWMEVEYFHVYVSFFLFPGAFIIYISFKTGGFYLSERMGIWNKKKRKKKRVKIFFKIIYMFFPSLFRIFF